MLKGIISGSEKDIIKIPMFHNGVEYNGWEVRDNEDRLIWGREDTFTSYNGVLSCKGYGLPLKLESLLGNGQQTGTPSPQNIIMPTFCGVRTGNLFPLDVTKLHVGRIENDGTIDYKIGTITVGTNSVTYQANAAWRGFYTDYILANGNEKLAFSPNKSSNIAWGCNCYDENDNFLGKAPAQSTDSIRTFTTLAGTKKVRISVTSSLTEYTITNPMLNLGSTALPYEPFGWAEKITCAGQTTPVYLGQVSTVRRVKKLVLTGEEAFSTPYGNSVFYVSSSGIGIAAHIIYEILCTHFTRSETNFVTQMADKNVLLSSTSLYIRMDAATTVSDFKSYLAAQYAAGTPVTIWYVLAEPTTGIVNEPLCKIGDYCDELNSADASVSIPTVKGDNTLTVDTDLQPSEMTITGHIKRMQFVYVTDSDGVHCFDSDGVQIIEEV